MSTDPRPRAPRRASRGAIAGSLFAATASLLGASAGPSLAQEAEQGWKFDASLSYYGEEGRVQDGSANVRVRRRLGKGEATLRLTVDTLTGASASGAVPWLTPQTFTSPSGDGRYETPARETPLDPTFLDTRYALSASWRQPAGSKGELDVGVSASTEYDYLHLGANGRYSLGLNSRNTTLGIGFALARDTVKPVGGAPVPLAAMLPVGAGGNKLDDGSKTVADALFGVTQVLGRKTIGELHYSFSRSSGYLTDPYKILSVVDPVTGDPAPGAGLPFLYRFESRPGTRTKHSLFAQVKHRLGRPVVDVSYRYMTDDWGISSHTVDLRWRQPLGEGFYLQPHLRLYTQSAADFYRPYLRDGDPLPDHASADYRLGALHAGTAGLKIGWPHKHERELSLRVEYYRQETRGPPGAAFGSLSGLDLFPGLSALIAQVEYRF